MHMNEREAPMQIKGFQFEFVLESGRIIMSCSHEEIGGRHRTGFKLPATPVMFLKGAFLLKFFKFD